MDGRSRGLRGRLSCHCLLLELGDQLALVDTGFGLNDVAKPRTRLSPFFLALTSPDFREEMTAIRQIEALGFDPRDVRHIILSHLDFDHAGGLDDFPWAAVHLLNSEREAAMARGTMLDRMRYRPQQWSTQANWISYTSGGESWYGFEKVGVLQGLPPEILLLPLSGHTFGHAAVALITNKDPMLYAGDAYFFHAEMDIEHPRCTSGLRLYQRLMEKDRTARLTNQHRLRKLRGEHPEVEVFCAHDVREFERLAGRGEAERVAGANPSPSPASSA